MSPATASSANTGYSGCENLHSSIGSLWYKSVIESTLIHTLLDLKGRECPLSVVQEEVYQTDEDFDIFIEDFSELYNCLCKWL
jgi:hypothetical protein